MALLSWQGVTKVVRCQEGMALLSCPQEVLGQLHCSLLLILSCQSQGRGGREEGAGQGGQAGTGGLEGGGWGQARS